MPRIRQCGFLKVDTGAPTRSHEFKVQDISCESLTHRSQGQEEHITEVKVSYKHLKKGYPVGREILLVGMTASQVQGLERHLKETGLAALLPFGVDPKGHATGSGLVVLHDVNLRPQDFSQTHTEGVTSLRACERDEVEKVAEFVADQFLHKEPMTHFQIGNKTMPEDALRKFVLSFIHEGDVPDLSLAIRTDGKLVAAALNETLAPPETELPPISIPGMERTLTLLRRQDEQALTFCSAHIRNFADAWKAGKVGHHFMIAGSGAGAAEVAFIETMRTFQQKGHEFVVIEATNPWTASMCEKHGGLAIESEAYGDDIKDSLPIGPPELSSVFHAIRLAQHG
jgi:hypothetical protein